MNYILFLKYYKNFFITSEDTLIYLISLNFSQNYSNIKKKIIFCYNHLLYL